MFNDETNNALKVRRYHENVPGEKSVDDLYNLVSQRSNYKYGTFMLAYLVNNEEIFIDYECKDTLAELNKDENQKQFFLKFSIKQKDGEDPVNVIVDTINVIEQDTEGHDVESYAGSFFKLHDSDEQSLSRKDYALPSNSSHNYDVASNISLKSSTGFVGLVNQAMTCYLNSLLQTLFMTPEFRNALYRWRFKGSESDATRSIPFQLQKLFLKLETSKKKAVETTDLTKSFGWDSSEAWQQHDVQELCRVMFDALEETLKNTDQANLINQLYQGEMKDYVKCLKCGHENSRLDNYLDISVDVRPFGSKESHENLGDALKAFITPETLDGNNQYFCEKCDSKQDAHKGLKFVSFPYLLTIQMKRFTFDYNTLQRIKLHDRLTFPYTLDLREYIEQEKDKDYSEINGCQCPSEEKSSENVVREEYCNRRNSITEEKDSTINGQEPNCCNDFSKGPYIYELFSVLIHSGSAVGGHYYAYIKSFDDDKWYCFNDQYVSQISDEDIEKSYGGIDKDRGGYYSSNYSSSTNAYMLMYRRIDNKCNRKFIKKSCWTNSLTDLCDRTLKDEVDEHTMIERGKETCNVRVYCVHPTSHVKLDGKISLHKDKTFKEATEMAWKNFNLENLVPLSQCRLIKYDDYNESYDRSFTEDEETSISKVLGGVRMNYGFDLLLECRKEEEQFKVYSPGGTTLKVYVISLDDSDFQPPRIIHVPLSLTVQQLKEQLDEYTGFSAEKLRIATYKEYHGFNLLGNPDRTLKQEGFYKCTKIFLEGISEEDAAKEFKESTFSKRLDVFLNTISIHITLPCDDEAAGGKKEILLNIDKRITLNILKEKIAQREGLEKDNFRVYRVYSNNQEFECVKGEEQLTNYLDDTKIVVKMGRALKEGEWRVKVFYLHVKNDEGRLSPATAVGSQHFDFLLEAIIGSGMSVKELKEVQVLEAFQKLGKDIVVERIRIRKKSYRNPCRVYPDTCVFDEDLNIGYTTELFAEILDCAERVTCDDDLSIYVRRWNPSTYILDEFQEVVLHTDTSISNFKNELEKISSIPADSIHIGKGRGAFPCVVSILDIPHEIDWNPKCSKLAEFPLSITDDGAVIYYKNCEEKKKSLTENEREVIRKKEREKSAPSTPRPNYRKEKALKIYTNGVKR